MQFIIPLNNMSKAQSSFTVMTDGHGGIDMSKLLEKSKNLSCKPP